MLTASALVVVDVSGVVVFELPLELLFMVQLLFARVLSSPLLRLNCSVVVVVVVVAAVAASLPPGSTRLEMMKHRWITHSQYITE